MPFDAEQFKDRLKRCKDHTREWRKEAKECYDFVACRQWTAEEQAILKEQLRPIVSFNRIGKIVDSISGHQINNRREVNFYPRQLGSAQVSEIMNAAMKWVDDECEAEDEISDCFMDMVICGMGWTEVRMSYDEEPDGKVISAERFTPFEGYWDLLATKRNLGDARWLARGRWWPRAQAEEEFPEIKKLSMLSGELRDDWQETAEPIDVTRAVFYRDTNGEWYNKHKDEVMIYHYQWWEHETQYRVGDPSSGRAVTLSANKFNKILRDQGDGYALMPGGQPVKFVKTKARKYYYAFVCGDESLDEGPIQCNDFTLLAMCAKHDETKNHWYGVVRALLDPQRWANKFFSTIQDIMMSNRQGGAFVEEDALVDPEQAEQDWAAANPLIMVKSGSLGQGKIQERSPIQYPAGVDRLLTYAIEAIPDTSGINMELLGLVDRQQPGILEAQRKQAGMTILARMFDSLRRYQKVRGKLVMKYINEYISDGRLIRVVGQDGNARYEPLMRDPAVMEYDVVVDEAPTSTNQKEQVWGVLSQLLPFLKGVGLPIPPTIVQYLPLPTSLQQDWAQMLQQTPSPEQQQAQALQFQEQQSVISKNQAQANESQTRAELNAAEVGNKHVEMAANIVNLATGTS